MIHSKRRLIRVGDFASPLFLLVFLRCFDQTHASVDVNSVGSLRSVYLSSIVQQCPHISGQSARERRGFTFLTPPLFSVESPGGRFFVTGGRCVELWWSTRKATRWRRCDLRIPSYRFMDSVLHVYLERYAEMPFSEEVCTNRVPYFTVLCLRTRVLAATSQGQHFVFQSAQSSDDWSLGSRHLCISLFLQDTQTRFSAVHFIFMRRES